jgi:hypothetical protein
VSDTNEEPTSIGDIITDSVMSAYARGFADGRKSVANEMENSGQPHKACDVCGKHGHHYADHTEPWSEDGVSWMLIRNDEGDVMPYKPFLGQD